MSPLAWAGTESTTHLHVWAAVVLGGIISLFPALLGFFQPGRLSTRYTIATAQMLTGALLIHLTGGRIETHFHVFGSLAFLAFYRDWRVLIPATVIVALDHLLRGMFWPESVYGVVVASQWRWVEHAAWVVFEDIFLVMSCVRSIAEMRQTAARTAALEQEVRIREQAESDARQSKARNQAILEVALDCVILIDDSGCIAQFNPAAERTFGYTAAEVVGTELAELLVALEHRDAHRAALTRYLETGEARILNRRIEVTAVRKGGERFPVEVVIAPISTDGKAMFAGYMRDITERKRAEAAQAERVSLASLTEAVGLALTHGAELDDMLHPCAEALVRHLAGTFAGIWMLDESAQTLHLQACSLPSIRAAGPYDQLPVGHSVLGKIARSRKPYLGTTTEIDAELGDLAAMPSDEAAAFAAYPLLLDSKLIGVMAVVSRVPFSASAAEAMSVVADGVAQGIVRKRAECELARYTRDLEKAHEVQRVHTVQLSALVDQLRILQEQAEAATRAKSDFLASMSHELRTPLNAIIMYSELLQELADDQGLESSIGDLQRIQSAAKHLLALINDILDLSKIEAGKMALSVEEFDVRALVDAILDTAGPLAQKNANTLTVQCASDVGTMTSDSMKTGQILLNLLSNAAKFTRNGTITLAVCRRTVNGRASIEFSVTDTGVGMSREQSAKIFDAFTQADPTTSRKYGGTGLGLALVSRFCQMLGGRVAVESEPGNGSHFTVQLPVAVGDTTAESLTAVGAA